MFLSHFGLLGHRKCPDNIRLRCNTHFCPHVPHIPAHTNTNTHTHTHTHTDWVSMFHVDFINHGKSMSMQITNCILHPLH